MAARVGLIARHHPAAFSAMTEAAAWLEAHGATPVVERVAAESVERAGRFATADRGELVRQVDLIVAFGGDGTLLGAASAVAQSERDVPVLGINLGHLGFLTEVGRADMTDALEAVIDGRTWTETRLMLEGHVERGAASGPRRLALNDIVITRGALSRMIELDVTADGDPVCHVKADGLIIATATGSTAYNLSAGGPIVHPSVDALVLTPIAPHTLTNRPVVLPASSTIVVRPLIEPHLTDIVATFDGQHGEPLGEGDAVIVTRAPRVLHLLRTTKRTHFDMLREKLHWGG